MAEQDPEQPSAVPRDPGAGDEYAWPNALVTASDAYEPARRRRPAFLRAIGLSVLVYFGAGFILGLLPIPTSLAGPVLLVAFGLGIYWSGRRYRIAGAAQWAIVVSGSVVVALVLAYGLLALMVAIVEHAR